jgi:hypothetical protein
LFQNFDADMAFAGSEPVKPRTASPAWNGLRDEALCQSHLPAHDVAEIDAEVRAVLAEVARQSKK